VIDGDTIATRGQTVRLVGFDTPEAGPNAGCESVLAAGNVKPDIAGNGQGGRDVKPRYLTVFPR
jgi:hypothetical protein